LRFLEHRVGDERVIRLVRKWLKAGVLEEGEWSVREKGTPKGAVASPLLANVYLHYVFDLWAHQWRRREAAGNVVVVRYADDIVAGFEHEADARRFWDAMRRIRPGGLFHATCAQSERDAQAILDGNCSAEERKGHDAELRLV
jgi:RNA-directed DNA polymerase